MRFALVRNSVLPLILITLASYTFYSAWVTWQEVSLERRFTGRREDFWAAKVGHDSRIPLVPASSILDLVGRSQSKPRPKLGYMFALKYYEQQTQAVKNFLQLQCLADSFNMQIVEPFVSGTQLMFSFPMPTQFQHLLKLGDLIDMKAWNHQATGGYGYPAIVSWGNLLVRAPRNVILVCVKCRDPPHISIPHPGANFRLGCSDSCFYKLDIALRFLKTYHFRLVKKACVNFAGYAGSVTPDDFLDNILEGGKYKREEVTIIMNEFRGFFGLYRMQLLSPCGLHDNRTSNMSVGPSQRLINESTKYSLRKFKDRPYASILVRVEKIVLHSLLNISQCMEEVVSVLDGLREQHGIEERFLSMDVGRFGSSGSTLHNLQPQGERFFKRIYGNKWTFRQWEDSFMRSTMNPAYIANLQRTLAAKGECLLMVGGGGFQAQARKLYEEYHPDINSRCVYKICAK